MNRIQPCPSCGCPVLYHHTPRDPVAHAGWMACDECSREKGEEVLCRSPTA